MTEPNRNKILLFGLNTYKEQRMRTILSYQGVQARYLSWESQACCQLILLKEDSVGHPELGEVVLGLAAQAEEEESLERETLHFQVKPATTNNYYVSIGGNTVRPRTEGSFGNFLKEILKRFDCTKWKEMI